MGGTVQNSTNSPIAAVSDELTESIWRRIFRQAIHTNATDIHIEPQIDALIVRFRRQGALFTDLSLEAEIARPLARQLKQLAGLDLRQTKTPQESVFVQVHNHHTYHLSVNTIPLVSGERIVIHIDDPVAQPPELSAMGLWGKSLAYLQNALAAPRGLILISGPNHSGVSTTLAGCAAALSSPSHHVASVEENAAYHLPDMTYMSVRPSNGMTWPRVLRMQLKHEPEVIILGNIPDRETAEIAIEAANRQQLILSGSRADNASLAVTQLLRLSGNPLDLAASLRLVCAQRLVPRLCPDCREAYPVEAGLQNRLAQMFRLDRVDAMTRLQQLEQEANDQILGHQLPLSKSISTDRHGIVWLWRAKAGGCHSCHKSGYRAAIGLFEVTPVNDSLRRQLIQPSSMTALYERINAERVSSLAVDALIKALCGLIAIEYVPGFLY